MKVFELLKRSQTLRLLLCAFMVPLLVVTSKGAVHAVDEGGATAPTSEAREFHLDMPRSTDIACGVAYSVTGGQLGGGLWSVKPGGWCEAKAIPEWGSPDLVDTQFHFTVKGVHADGEATSWDVDWPKVGEEDGWFSNTILMGQPSVPISAGWQMHSLCLTARDTFGFDHVGTQCHNSSLAVAPSRQVCEDGEWTHYEHAEPHFGSENGSVVNKRWQAMSKFKVLDEEYGTHAAQEWLMYVVMRPPNGGALTVESLRSSVSGTPELEVWVNAWLGDRTSGGQNAMQREIIGAGVVNILGENYIASNYLKLPSENPDGVVGKNDPGDCRFYMGEKIYDDGASGGFDEPSLPLPPAGEPVEAPPEAETPDRPGDEKGDPWWSSLLSVLREVRDAIKGLVDGIIEGVKGLFIPDEFPDWSSIDIDMPSGWVPELPTVPSGACGPIALPFVDAGMVGAVQAESFIDTCETPWTHGRTMIYYGILATAFIVVGQRILRAVMNALGMGVDSPSGGDD